MKPRHLLTTSSIASIKSAARQLQWVAMEEEGRGHLLAEPDDPRLPLIRQAADILARLYQIEMSILAKGREP